MVLCSECLCYRTTLRFDFIQSFMACTHRYAYQVHKLVIGQQKMPVENSVSEFCVPEKHSFEYRP